MRNHARLIGLVSGLVCAIALLGAGAAGARVLLVGTYHGIRGGYRTIQAAVNAARPGDWILVGPGDYKTTKVSAPAKAPQFPAAVLITKPNLFIRGMSRGGVIVDATRPGTRPCSSSPAAQNFGPTYGSGPSGLNGIEVYKANDVWVQNLTVCNFFSGTADAGNGVWWNGGAGGGHIHGWGFLGSYLSATATYYRGPSDGAGYGIFSSDWSGGVFANDYASNMDDSGFYIGGCAQRCNQVIRNSRSEFNALGYSGTNSGGSMLIEHNIFDHNQDGFDTNAQNNSDWPSPQTGACPHGIRPPLKGARTCWVLYDNLFYANNNPNVPAVGSAAAGPVGTGVSIEGRYDTVMGNTFKDNGAWGIVFQPYPDTETPPPAPVAAGKACAGGLPNYSFLQIPIACMYDDWGNQLIGNHFVHNGFFHNPTNGDFAEATLLGGHPINCYAGNTDASGTVTSSPANLQRTNAACGKVRATPDENLPFVFEALCDTQALGQNLGCNTGDRYPRETHVVMPPLPRKLQSMPNPCAGVPANKWCPAHRSKARSA